MAEYIIANGQTLTDITFASGDIVTVQNGGTLSDAVIPKTVASVTLEDGAILSGSIKTAKEFSFSGNVNAALADLDLDISACQPEEKIFLNSLFDTQSISITVSPDQDKGTYRLFGGAADFTGAISVKTESGFIFGELTLEDNVLDYDITRYTLSLNDANEVCVTVSSNIPDTSDYVLLYKGNELVATAKSMDGVTISAEGEYDKAVILNHGVLTNSVLDAGGLLVIYSGSRITGLTQNGGSFHLTLTAGDGTVFTGTNQYGEFSYQNGYAENLYAGSSSGITVGAETELHDVHLFNGGVTVLDGGTISGNCYIESGSTINLSKGGVAKNLKAVYDVYGGWINMNRAFMFDSEIADGLSVELDQAFIENSVISGPIGLTNSNTFKNVTLGENAYVFYREIFGEFFNIVGTLTLDGDLTVPLSSIRAVEAPIDANGKTIIIDLKDSNSNTRGYLNFFRLSEDAEFRLDIRDSQTLGRYTFGFNVSPFRRDSFSIYCDDEYIGTLSVDNPEVTNGDWKYTLICDGCYSLSIDLSDDVGEDKSVWYWDASGQAYSGPSFDGLSIGSDDCKDVYILNGGVLSNSSLDADGRLQIHSGAQINDLAIGEGTYYLTLTAGDGTVFTGTSQYGEFSYQNGYAENLYAGSSSGITVGAETELHNAHLADGGVTVLVGGTISGNCYMESGSTINLSKDGVAKNLKAISEGYGWINLNQASMFDSEIADGLSVNLEQAYIENSVISGQIGLTGNNTFKNVTLGENAYVYSEEGALTLDGDLTVLLSSIRAVEAPVDANGNTIIIDLKDSNSNTRGYLNFSLLSEDVKLRLDVRDSQTLGSYTFGLGVGTFIDFFSVYCDDEYVGSLSRDNPEVTNGDWKYTLIHDVVDQRYSLKVDLSDDVGVDKSVWYWDASGQAYSGPSFDGLSIGSADCKDVYILNGGVLSNSSLDADGRLQIRSGAQINDLTIGEGTYYLTLTAGDGTVFTGTSQYGAFSYQDGYAENLYVSNSSGITVGAGVKLHNAHLADGGVTVQDGATISGNCYIESGSTINLSKDGVAKNLKAISEGYGWLNMNQSSMFDSEIMDGLSVYLEQACIENSVLSGQIGLTGNNTFRNVTLGKNTYVYHDTYSGGHLTLDGDLTILLSSIRAIAAPIDANGNTIILDLTGHDVNNRGYVEISHMYNAQLALQIDNTPFVGRHLLGLDASGFGEGNAKGVWNPDTNVWDFKGAVVGDLDGIVEIRDQNGILLANCTVNGDTEYFGRYNYTVIVDNGGLYLDIGWNTREGRTYAADGYDNDTFEKASSNPPVVLPASGTKLTIDSATDVDWFQFTLDTIGRKSSCIGIDFKQWAGDLDLYLYDSNGNLLNYAKSVTDNERISLKGLAAGDYYVKVEGYEGNVNEYKLAYSLPEPIVLTDEYELGNTPFSAVPLWTITGPEDDPCGHSNGKRCGLLLLRSDAQGDDGGLHDAHVRPGIRRSGPVSF